MPKMTRDPRKELTSILYFRIITQIQRDLIEIPQKGFEKFIELCVTERDQKELKFLFDLFFTPEEKANLGLRYLIIKELLENKKTQRQIAKDLNVSIAKITRGSNELKRLDPKFIKMLKNLMRV